jgi:hypothetical protein
MYKIVSCPLISSSKDRRHSMSIKILYFVTALTLVSCGARKEVAERTVLTESSARKILKNHQKNKFDKQTLSADLKLNFAKKNSSRNVSVKLRIQTGKMLWLSGSFFGLPILKATITPNHVRYYNKLNKTYYEGDFSSLSKLLGTEVSFEMLQNLLLGDAIVPVRSRHFSAKITNQSYLLHPKNSKHPLRFWFHPFYYKIEKQEVRNPDKEQMLTIAYKNYKNIENTRVPGSIELWVQDKSERAQIEIDFRSVSIDKKLSFPYKVPKGYQKIDD